MPAVVRRRIERGLPELVAADTAERLHSCASLRRGPSPAPTDDLIRAPWVQVPPRTPKPVRNPQNGHRLNTLAGRWNTVAAPPLSAWAALYCGGQPCPPSRSPLS